MTARGLAWLDRLVWALIYAGLLMVVLGIATGPEHRVAGWSLGVLGSMVAAAGCLLVWVRSRIGETPPGGAQSPPDSSQGKP